MDVPASLARPDDSLLGGASGAALRIAAEHSAMMAGFAADGVPGGPFAEAWARHDASRRACLIVSDETHPVDDPDGEARAFWAQYPMPASVA
jgi:para-nitrobenzyl esterase